MRAVASAADPVGIQNAINRGLRESPLMGKTLLHSEGGRLHKLLDK